MTVSASSFFSLIKNRWEYANTLLCVGLDPDIQKMPQKFRDETLPLSERLILFNKALIDATEEYVCCYKPQSAFYEQYGVEGLLALSETIAYIHERYSDIPVLLDAKRGDVGNTAAAYATTVFDVMKADGVTINPYLGKDSVEPFLKREEKGIIILAKTSNPGSGDFQNKLIDGMPMYEYVATTVFEKWNSRNNCGLVVGATYPEELKKVREIVHDMPLLIPGIGAQGGSIEETVTNGKDSNGTGMIISSSRAILYASSGTDFAEAAGHIALSTKNEINKWR
jgi:orotidine-5'-phosphate decarboxylase